MRREVQMMFGVALVILLLLPLSGNAVTGTIQDVQHVVILMQENRSFGHYFGSMKGVRGFDDPTTLIIQSGLSAFYQPQGVSYVLPFHTTEQCLNDVEHDWFGEHQVWNAGQWNAWVSFNGPSSMSYYTRDDLPFYYALADAYTICDANYCSVMGPTFPNRLYMFTGTIDPQGTSGGPVTQNLVPPGGFTWTTYPERLQAAGISWRVYRPDGDWFGDALPWFAQFQNAVPGEPLYDRGLASVPDVVAALLQDVTNGTLPTVSWIVPPYELSEHPPYSPASGEGFVKQLLDALASNPDVYNSTVFILTYDENGGFFHHVPPPVPPADTPDEFVGGWPIGLGTRVPMILVSPWTRGGYVCSQVFDHTSILRFLEQVTGVPEPNISAWRRQVCGDLTSAFDFANPDTSLPDLPTPAPVNCSSGVILVPPPDQIMPTQEVGTKIARPLPYQPNAASSSDCVAVQFLISLTNSGATSVHYSIYSLSYSSDGPRQYDVLPGGSITDSFPVTNAPGGQYDLACYGPNGFLRRFIGHVDTNCGPLEVTSTLDPVAGGVLLHMQNSSDMTATFTVTSGYTNEGPWIYPVPPGDNVMDTFFTGTDNNSYDLTATVDIDPAFLRRFAGHIENGLPALVGKIPPPVVNFVNYLPMLTGTISAGNLLLSYPAQFSGYTLESSPDLSANSWNPVDAIPTTDTNGNNVVTVPIMGDTLFFRLQP